jgi:hypothetical protein
MRLRGLRLPVNADARDDYYRAFMTIWGLSGGANFLASTSRIMYLERGMISLHSSLAALPSGFPPGTLTHSQSSNHV